MRLDAATRDILEKWTRSDTDPPGICDGSWTALFMKLFPMSQSYAVCPQKRHGAHGDLIMEVAKVLPSESHTERRLRILLVVEIKNPQHWDSGKEKLLQQLEHQTDLAFKTTELGAAKDKLFWIASIGPHWQYGEKKYGQTLNPLIEWHHDALDDASFLDLEKLAELVGSLDE